MRTLDSHDIKSGIANLRVPAGQYGALMIRASGTNDTGDDTVAADMGIVTARWGGRSWVQIKFDQLQFVNDVLGGFVEGTSTTAGAFAFSAMLTSSYSGDGNIYDIHESDNVFIQVNLSGIDADQLSGTLELIGLPREGHMMYLPEILGQTPSIAANGVLPVNIPMNNITHLFIAAQTNVARVGIYVDGREHTEIAQAAMQAASNMLFRKEATYSSMSAIAIAPSGKMGEALSDDVVVRITATGSAATPDLITVGLNFTPDLLSRSRSINRAVVAERLNRKRTHRKGSAEEVARTLRSEVSGIGS